MFRCVGGYCGDGYNENEYILSMCNDMIYATIEDEANLDKSTILHKLKAGKMELLICEANLKD